MQSDGDVFSYEELARCLDNMQQKYTHAGQFASKGHQSLQLFDKDLDGKLSFDEFTEL